MKKMDFSMDVPEGFVPRVTVHINDARKAPKNVSPFTKVYHQNMEVLTTMMTPDESHLFHWLTYHMAWDTNMVVDGDGCPMSVKDVTEQYPRQLCQRQVIRLLNGLVSLKAVHKGRAGTATKFHVNPALVYFGKEADLTLLSLFGIKPNSEIKKRGEERTNRKSLV